MAIYIGNREVQKVYRKNVEVSKAYRGLSQAFDNNQGPDIVTSGLLVYLDPGQSSSYPGTGTTITDLSGNGYNGTLVNGPSYSSSNGGVIVLDGSDDYIEVSIDRRNNDYTIMGAARYVSVGGRTFSAKDNNWLMGHWSTSTTKHYAEGWVTDSGGSENSDTSWRIYTATRSGADTWSFYVNNSLDTSNTGGSQGPYNFTIGKYGPGNSEHSNSEISFFLVYNRVLDSTEMTQNYNAFKDRFGL